MTAMAHLFRKPDKLLWAIMMQLAKCDFGKQVLSNFWLKIIAAFLDFYCSGNVGERTKFLPREGAIGGQNKGEERGGDIRNHRATIDEKK